jgi:hypothetical protein
MGPAVIWFVAGFALGVIVIAFAALGAYERGLDSARRERFSAELASRRIVGMSRRAGRSGAAGERASA